MYLNNIQGEAIEYDDFQIAVWMICVKLRNPPQKRQAMHYKVTLRRVRATTVAVEKPQVLHILSVCL